MNLNGVMMQYFECSLPPGSLWNKLAAEAASLAEGGVTAVWLPPPYKGAAGREDIGYAVYDLYDLGEFDQRGSVATKYGTRDELLAAIATAQAHGIEVYADVVLDHRIGADGLEKVQVEEYNPENRLEKSCGPAEIEAYTHFFFPGRKGKYSDFEWHWFHFTGVDFDGAGERQGLFKFRGKYWERQVDRQFGNFDYLMGASLDLNHLEVRRELKRWGEWFVRTTGVDGFRLDAVKHMKFTFFNEWLGELRSSFKRELFTVGEYWRDDFDALKYYLETTEGAFSLFDVPLHWNFYRASKSGRYYDLRKIFDKTLTAHSQLKSVTFVDNHDTQPGQSLDSWVEDWFKPAAYALILLRNQGYPCIFYGDYYGIECESIPPKRKMLRLLLEARTRCAHGRQRDYFDDPNAVGWTREGDERLPGSGLAVVLGNDGPAVKHMRVGARHAGAAFRDALGNSPETLLIDEKGEAVFHAPPAQASVWVPVENGLTGK